MYIVKFDKTTLGESKQTPETIIQSELCSFQIEGTGNIIVESCIDGSTWHQNKNIKNVIAPCFVEMTDCIIGTRLRLITDGDFESVTLNL